MAKYDWKVEPRDEDWSDDFNKFEESMKEEKKSIEESKDKFVIWSNEGYLDYDGTPSENIADDDAYMTFDTEKDAEKYINDLKKKYDNKWSDSLEVHNMWESKKSARKSLKEYRTVGFEQLVRDTIISILEDPHSDLFEIQDGIITYDNKGRAEILSNGDVDMDYITLPAYFWSSGERPSNKKTAKLIDDIIDINMKSARERLWDKNKDELIELGITSEDDENLEYHALYDMGASDLAEELSEYEMDLEGTDLYTDVYCGLEETDEGIELTVSMTVEDEYGHILVKDYKSNIVLLQEDADDLEEFITDAIKEVTEQF